MCGLFDFFRAKKLVVELLQLVQKKKIINKKQGKIFRVQKVYESKGARSTKRLSLFKICYGSISHPHMKRTCLVQIARKNSFARPMIRPFLTVIACESSTVWVNFDPPALRF